MSALVRLLQHDRAVHCYHMAAGLPDWLARAEANDLSYFRLKNLACRLRPAP